MSKTSEIILSILLMAFIGVFTFGLPEDLQTSFKHNTDSFSTNLANAYNEETPVYTTDDMTAIMPAAGTEKPEEEKEDPALKPAITPTAP